MALNRYGKPQIKYNSRVDTEYKPYLPVIGNVIPSKSLGKFDNLTEYTVTGDTDMGLDGRRAYRADYCRYLSIAAAAKVTLTYEPETALDLLSLGNNENNFADIVQTGKYKTGGTSLKDTLHFVLNIGHVYSDISTRGTFIIKMYSGTKTATLTTAQSLGNRIVYSAEKYQFILTEDAFTYADDFEDDDFSAIDKIEITITQGTNTLHVYFHEAWTALPKFTTTTIEDSYYPSISATTSIYVSWLFGDERNAGTTRGTPVKTIEKGLSLLTSTRVNLVILDSETYKVVNADYTCGIKGTIQDGARILSDYLETAEISASPGVFNNKIGARKNNRTSYFGKAHITVGASGADYTTIAAAYAAATSENIIEIIDDGVYDEAITINKSITIQAKEGKLPRWTKTTSGIPITFLLTSTEIYARFYGIEFYGRGASGEYCFTGGTNAGAYTGRIFFTDCTFTNFGSTTTTIICNLLFAAATATELFFDNCLWIDNKVADCFYANAGCRANVYFRNCKAFLDNNAGSKFVYLTAAPNAGGATYNVSAIGCEIYGKTNESLSLAMYAGGSTASAGASSGNMFYCKTNTRIYILTDCDVVRLRHNDFFGLKAMSTNDQMIYAIPDTSSFVDNNFFRSYETGGSFSPLILTSKSGGNNNIFANNAGACLAFLTGQTHTSEIFYNNSTCLTGSNGTARGCVFLGNALVGNVATTVTHTLNNSILYENTAEKSGGGTLTVADSCTRTDPQFVNPSNLRFGWFPESPINTSMTADMGLMTSYVAALSNAFNLSFIRLAGIIGAACNGSPADPQSLRYCTIEGWGAAYKNTSDYVFNLYNSKIKNNDMGVVLNGNINLKNNVKNNIIENNGTGVLLSSAADIQHNTIINNGYGIYGLTAGYFSVVNYAENFVVIKDNIIFNNDVIDYHYNLPTSYCIIGTRYFDMLDPADPDYAVTVGAGDISDNPLLTEDYYPALKVLGYKEDSPAYLAASDGGNIGARDENHIKSVVNYNSYTMPASPQDYIYNINPVNVESVYSVNGDFESESDADVIEISFSWADPGRRSKIMSTQKTVMEAMFATYWFIGLSLDGGATWQYYKVKKDNGLSFKQAGYYYHELPWADVNIELVNMAGFDPTDYEVDTWS